MPDARFPASAQRLRAVVESSPIGLLMVDARGTIVLVNAEVERLFGYSRELMFGRQVEFLLPERFRNGHPGARDAFRANPSTRQMGAGRELRALRADGTEFPVEIGLTPVATDEGLFVVGSIVDITARLAAAHERAQLEDQLRQAQKLEALGTLAGGVAHDFNNVLASIVGLAELLVPATQDTPEVNRDVRELLDAARHGRAVVERILRFSRRQPMRSESVDVREVVAQSTRLLRASLPPNVRITTQLTAAPRLVRGDPTSLQQVLMNLATNAAHAMPDGGRLEIITDDFYVRDGAARSRPGLREGTYLALTVRDDGHGMDEATRLKAFEPFFTTKVAGEGSGLGLALVHGIVRDHDGVVELESVPGRGTVVRCLFPLLEGTMPATDAAPGALARGSGERIVYLDDEPTLVRIGQRQLEALGYHVTGFSDARAALAALQADPTTCDVVVTDFLMPTMTGLEFARAVQQLRPSLPVLVLSGYIGDFTVSDLEAGGVRRVLQKPVSAEELALAVHECLAGG
ncbi:MAG TPA: PAS domain S-box protein [Gemmatimonadaceae bacterium]|nr:PAS domain S-box protein [Gemmatimonadaceae bacterium]